jgi:predicted transcriptional regulator
MIKHGIDQEALISRFSEATAKQGEAIRKAVTETTLKALQGRELSLSNIKQVLNTVAKAASTGAAGSALPVADVETLLANAVAGMDAALEKAVQANRKALQQMVDQGADLRETQVKKALADIEKMEDTLFAALRKAADGSQASLEGPWAEVLKATRGKGTGTGAQASATITQLMDSAQDNLRQGRALGMTASQAMLDGYSTLVSGVLIGMSDALQQGGAAPAPPRKK